MKKLPEVVPMPVRLYPYTRFSSKPQETGDSMRRQKEFIDRAAKEEKAVVDESLVLEDQGVSAHRGENALVGALSGFLDAVKTGRVTPGSILAIECLDRLTRQKVGKALELFMGILNAGVVIRTAIPDRRYTADSINDTASILEALIYMVRAYEESHTKSIRLRAVWSQKKLAAVKHRKPLGKNCPAWIELTPDGYRLIPERAAIVRQIFAFLQSGLGFERIASILQSDPVKYPCFAQCGAWSPAYVRLIVLKPTAYGAYQPRAREDGGAFVPDGPLVLNYYPAVVSESEWRAALAIVAGRRGAAGRPGAKETNLFTGILYEAKTSQRLSVRPQRARGRLYQYLVPPRARADRKLGAGMGCRYDQLEDGFAWAFSELGPQDVLPPDRRATERQRQIRDLSSEIMALDEKLRQLEAQQADPAQDADVLPSLARSIGMVVRQKREKVEASRVLKEKEISDSGAAESLGAVQTLFEVLSKVRGTQQEGPVRLRIKAGLRRLLDSIWVLVQPVRRGSVVLHVQMYFRCGRRKYVQIAPKNPPEGTEPWQLSGADFRAGDIGSVAANPEALAQLVG
jgi:DNA invertase Pin-like site-specific DNA recombinase